MSDQISDKPTMDDAGFERFAKALQSSRCYLEYGCGGSTVFACETAKVETVISVESDRAWSERVKEKLADTQTTLLIEHCDIGTVGEWGTPKTREKIGDFWRYMATPWEVAKAKGLRPDLILVDGRFRVASFLYSLVNARVGATILFDDYLNRPKYFEVENFCRLRERCGRMGVFTVDLNYSIPEVCQAIAKYSIVWD